MNPSTMIERLRQRYPKRYTLPTETVIRQEISQLFLKQKTSEDANCEGEDADEDRVRKTQSKRARIPVVYVNKLEEYLQGVDDYRTLKGNHAYAKIVEDFKGDDGSLPSNFPAEAIIKRKFAALKGTFKVRQVAEFIQLHNLIRIFT